MSDRPLSDEGDVARIREHLTLARRKNREAAAATHEAELAIDRALQLIAVNPAKNKNGGVDSAR